MDPILRSSVQIKETAFKVRNLHRLPIVLAHYLLANVKNQSQFWHLCVMNSLQCLGYLALGEKTKNNKTEQCRTIVFIKNICWKNSCWNKFAKALFSLFWSLIFLVVYYITCFSFKIHIYNIYSKVGQIKQCLIIKPTRGFPFNRLFKYKTSDLPGFQDTWLLLEDPHYNTKIHV